MLNAKDIASDAVEILRQGCGYIWGTSGEVWDQKKQWELEDKYNSNPSRFPDLWGSAKYGSKWFGKHVYDCSGLVMRICANHGLKLPHGSNSQYNECKNRGWLDHGQRKDGEPLKAGTLVFLYRESDNCRNHVGIYIGDGDVIEAKGGMYGVVKSKVSAWDEWGELLRVDYGYKENTMETIRKGSKGAAVYTLQEILEEKGYPVARDGIFGSLTLQAVKSFQRDNGLEADGIVGPATWAALGSISNGVIDAGNGVIGNKNVVITLQMDVFEALKKAIEVAK